MIFYDNHNQKNIPFISNNTSLNKIFDGLSDIDSVGTMCDVNEAIFTGFDEPEITEQEESIEETIDQLFLNKRYRDIDVDSILYGKKRNRKKKKKNKNKKKLSKGNKSKKTKKNKYYNKKDSEMDSCDKNGNLLKILSDIESDDYLKLLNENNYLKNIVAHCSGRESVYEAHISLIENNYIFNPKKDNPCESSETQNVIIQEREMKNEF